MKRTGIMTIRDKRPGKSVLAGGNAAVWTFLSCVRAYRAAWKVRAPRPAVVRHRASTPISTLTH